MTSTEKRHRIYPPILARARELRHPLTPAEIKLWARLRNRQLDGFKFLEIVKADEELRDVPVIVVTAKELNSTERRRLEGQVESLLQKGSFTEEDLLDNIQEALE